MERNLFQSKRPLWVLCDPWSIGKAIQSLQDDLTIVMLFQHSAVGATNFLSEGGYMCVLISIAVDFVAQAFFDIFFLNSMDQDSMTTKVYWRSAL